jgi:hypothetical protein
MKPLLLILCCCLAVLPSVSYGAVPVSVPGLSIVSLQQVVSASAAHESQKKSGFFARMKNNLGKAISGVKKFFQEGRPKLLAGAFLLGLLLGPLAFLFFIGNHNRNFRYSIKVGFATFLFVALGVLIVLVLI